MQSPLTQHTPCSVRLAIVATHPVQYNAPWFRLLAQHPGLDVKVFYTWQDGTQAITDPGFGRQITWDLPLTEGYALQYVPPSTEVESRSFRNMDSPALVGTIEAYQPTAILVIGWNFRSHLRALRHFHGRIPVLFRGDSTLLDKRSGPKELVRSTVLRWVLKFVDYGLSVGTNNTAYFRHHGLTEEQIVHVPHAIDNARFSGTGPDYDNAAATIRRELGFRESDTVLLFAGKFEHKKRPDRLLDLFLRAVPHRPDMQLLLVGNGIMEEQLKKRAEGCDAVRFLPFQNQNRIPIIYRVGDITVLPSEYNETWGLALNESMASGRTVMATTQVGAAVDLIQPGTTGFLLDTEASGNDGADQALRELPDRPALLEMGVDCREFIKQQWTFEMIVERISQLLLSLAPGELA